MKRSCRQADTNGNENLQVVEPEASDMGIEVDFYWWRKTPRMKLIEPVLRTNYCCHRARR